MGDIALCVVGLLTQQVADGAELQTALKKTKKKNFIAHDSLLSRERRKQNRWRRASCLYLIKSLFYQINIAVS